MAMVSLGPGVHVGCGFGGGWWMRVAPGTATLNAAGESLAMIGVVSLSTGPGTSATLSTGSVYLRTGAVTFASGSTNVRVGVQDVASTGLEDGTFDVYVDLVGGSGGVTANALIAATMATGTKTITHGDMIAVVIEMTARGGADSVVVSYIGNAGGTALPYITTDTGSGPVRSANGPMVTIVCDGGVVASFGEEYVATLDTATAFHSGSTPDEYALLFSLPFSATVSALSGHISDLDAGDDGEFILYSNPLGTPVAERTVAHDGDYAGSTGSTAVSALTLPIAPYNLSANTVYAVAYRPTNTNTRALTLRTIGAAGIREAGWLGTSIRQGTRTNQSGAFSETTTEIPSLGCVISHIDVPAPSPRTRPLRSL